ncbi:uncharacterized protein UTRI_03959 [Ustilago trichophora]|uniref:Cyclin-like domain-containing protein n=1 Tax=Ustilago trichophora TaxID=86804 RepID=A0A5C3E8C0_9BASI|nr:uncharacterized protein UTRI_03959 [Ustilago trichophora]
MLLNPLATRQQLAVTPSMTDGLSYDLEMELRALGCQIIQQVGILLRLPQRTMAVAQVFFQRFWFTSSMCDFSASEIAMGALLLATKLEETQIRLRHLINAFHYVDYHISKNRHLSPDWTPSSREDRSNVSLASSADSLAPPYCAPAYDSAELSRLRDAVVVSEMQILKRLGFHVQVTLPYALLVNYLQALGLTDSNLKVTVKPHFCWSPENATPPPIDKASSQPVTLAQCAWSFLNDALQTPVLCIFGPHIVACAAIALAAEMCVPQVNLPLEPAPWWLLFDASEPEIKIAASHLLWRYHHQSSVRNVAALLDRHELRRHVAAHPASPKSHAEDMVIHKSW